MKNTFFYIFIRTFFAFYNSLKIEHRDTLSHSITLFQFLCSQLISWQVGRNMATNTLQGAMIVKELLKKENYKEWSACMQNYLFAHDLWNVVAEDPKKRTVDWKRKNAAAFHAILISCGKEAVDLILDCSSAKDSASDAWYTLAGTFRYLGVFSGCV